MNETVETRNRWEAVEPPPEGWRFCHGAFDYEGRYWSLWSNAPLSENPHNFKTRWIESRAIPQQRTVTEWTDVPQSLDSLQRKVT